MTEIHGTRRKVMDSNKEPKHQIDLLLTAIQLRTEHVQRLRRLCDRLITENKVDLERIEELELGD